jgi:predicted ribosomally synthesized peptide with SipW-like signal peptide
MFIRRREKIKAAMRSRVKIIKSAQKSGMVLALLFLIIGYGKIQGTNSFFSDDATSSGNSFTAAVWIPTLTYTVEKPNPDGQNSWYVTKPCIKLYSDLDNVTINYSFTGSNPGSGTVAEDTCLDAPEGMNHFSATAVNNEDSSWASSPVGQDFKVDTQCPFAEITDPGADEKLNGSAEIKGTVTDANPDHYWLVIEDSGGHQIAGPGTVSDANSFTDKKFFDWNTTAFSDGDYKIKLEARDKAGNKCPNQSPVTEDPNNPDDSVDWINVKVDNTNLNRYIVLNEILPNPAGADNVDKDRSEFVELYNKGNIPLDLNGWRIYIGDSDFIEINDTNTDGKGTTIGKKDFLVVWLYKKWGDSIMNNSNEKVSLYNGLKSTSDLIDEYEYSKGDIEDKSSARIPDGKGDWEDPIPTPGKPNKPGDENAMNVDEEVSPVETNTNEDAPVIASKEFGITTAGSLDVPEGF